MTIHYIYVNDFRNLYNEHINLTGEYSLDINEKKQFRVHNCHYRLPENFWGEKITAVSGIIGKNGSGKTNILELITYLLFTPKSLKAECEFVLIYTPEFSRPNEVNVLTNISRSEDIIKGIRLKIIYKNIYESPEDLGDFKCVFFSNINDGIRKHIPSTVIDLSNLKTSTWGHLQPSNISNEIAFFESDISHKLKFEYPKRISIKFPSFTRSQLQAYEALQKLRTKILKSKSSESVKYWFLYYLFIDLAEKSVTTLNTPTSYRGDLHGILYDFESRVNLDASLPQIMDSVINYILSNKFWQDKRHKIDKLVQLVYDMPAIMPGIHEQEGKRLIRNDSFIIEYNEFSRELISYYIDIFPKGGKIQFSWHGLSSGHKAFLNLFSKLLSIKKRVADSALIILIDEGDLYLHPQWQKEYLSRLLEFLELEFDKSMKQVILTSHSPFIVSDLPRSNLHLLHSREDKENIRPNFQTFGANIFELFSQSFFIKDGNIGSFADHKLKYIISAIQDNIDIETKRELMNLIGDDFLKKYLTISLTSNDTN